MANLHQLNSFKITFVKVTQQKEYVPLISVPAFEKTRDVNFSQHTPRRRLSSSVTSVTHIKDLGGRTYAQVIFLFADLWAPRNAHGTEAGHWARPSIQPRAEGRPC